MSRWQALLLLSIAPMAARAEEARLPTTEAMVAGAEACATKSLSDTKMAERLAGLGWAAKDKAEPAKGMRLSTYAKGDVELVYFTSPEMKQCIARAATPPDFEPRPLLAALSAKLGKEPKAEEPGRYLYFLPRLDILTVLIKSDAQGPHVEMSVVQ